MVCMDVDPRDSTRRLVLREALGDVTGESMSMPSSV